MPLLPLEVWLTRQFGAGVITIATARRWCRAGRIRPAPRKIGRGYFLHPDAEYIDDTQPTIRLARRPVTAADISRYRGKARTNTIPMVRRAPDRFRIIKGRTEYGREALYVWLSGEPTPTVWTPVEGWKP